MLRPINLNITQLKFVSIGLLKFKYAALYRLKVNNTELNLMVRQGVKNNFCIFVENIESVAARFMAGYSIPTSSK